MFVKVYGDESGTHDATGKEHGSEVNCVAGYAAWEDDWENLCGDWQTTLDKYKVPYFRFSEWVPRKNLGPDKPGWIYRHLNDTEHYALALELAAIATRHTLFGVGVCITTKDYHELADPPRVKKVIEHPYYISLMGFYEMIMSEVNKRFKLPGAKLAYFFDSGTQFPGRAVNLFNISKRYLDPDERMASITHIPKSSPKNNLLPLQAADLLAGRIRQKRTNVISGRKTEASTLDQALCLGSHITLAGLPSADLKKMVETIEAHLKKRNNG